MPSTGSTVPTPVRDAATVMVVRDTSAAVSERGVAELEVLLLHRNLQSAFVSGVHLFPGGAVDDDDHSPAAVAQCRGLDDAVASTRLGVVSGGLGLWFAVVRECFEECGLLLATAPDGTWPDWSRRGDELAELRHQAMDPTTSFAQLLAAAGLVIPAERVHYWSRWVTPVGAVRRYDTRFFVCAAPPHQTPEHDAVEAIAHTWARPAHMVAEHDLGNIALVTPTRKSLEALARFRSVAELLAAAAHDPTIDAIASLIPTAAPEFGHPQSPVRLSDADDHLGPDAGDGESAA